MIEGLEPYRETRDSGLPWLGDLPASWEVRRNGRIFVQRNETGFPDLPILEVSLRTGVRVRDADSGRKQVMADRAKYKRAVAGDVAYNMMRMWQGAVGVVPRDGLISPAYVVARPLPGTVAGYFAYLYRTALYMGEVDNYSRGIVKDRNRLYWEQFKQIPTPYPPPAEQTAIVRFLDHAERRIRRYIRAKQKLIKILDEQKQAIIHQAVTRGLDPSRPTKNSGVPWIPVLPAHWDVMRFKTRVRFQEGPGIMAVDFRPSGVPLLRIAGLRNDVASLDGCNFIDQAMVEKKWSHFRVKRGDYLLSSSASTGKVVLATEIVVGAIPYTGIIRLWPRDDSIYMPFVCMYIGSRPFQDQIDAAKSGVGIEHFGPTHLKRMVIGVPPFDEQRQIAGHVARKLELIRPVTDRALREIELLHELRTRLISDVVTGQLDVRAAAAALPDETAEDEPLDDADELDVDDLDLKEDAVPEGEVA